MLYEMFDNFFVYKVSVKELLLWLVKKLVCVYSSCEQNDSQFLIVSLWSIDWSITEKNLRR